MKLNRLNGLSLVHLVFTLAGMIGVAGIASGYTYDPDNPPAINNLEGLLVEVVEYDSVTFGTGDSAYSVEQTTDSAGIVTRREYDSAGRVTRLIENYDATSNSGKPLDTVPDKNRTTLYTYTSGGQIKTQSALLHDDGTTPVQQTTTYIYSSELTAPGDPVPANNLLRAIIYPDSDDTLSSGALTNGTDGIYDRVEMTYYTNGALATRKDQREVVLTYVYDDANRRTKQYVSADPNNAVTDGDAQTDYTYTDAGQIARVTAFETTSSGTGTTIKSEVLYEYNGLSQITREYQSHDAAVVTTGGSESPFIAYTYDDSVTGDVFTAGHRLIAITYPNGRVIHQVHGAEADAESNRVIALAEDNGSGTPSTAAADQIVQYGYLGSPGGGGGGVDTINYPVPNIRRANTWTDNSVSPSVTHDRLDDYGRVAWHHWERYDDTINPAGDPDGDIFKIRHEYDAAGNRLYAERKIYKSYSQHYTYDELHRLTQFAQGKIKSDLSGIEDRWQLAKKAWTLDQLGNALAINTRTVDDKYVSTYNAANEITLRQVKSSRSKKPLHTDVFSNNNYLSDWEQPSGATDQFEISGGAFRFTQINQDSFEPEPRAIALLGENIGLAALISKVKFDADITAGEFGYVFGYKSEDDYWLDVISYDYNGTRIYHVVDGVKTLEASISGALAAGATAFHALVPQRKAIAYHSYFRLDLPQGYPSGRIGLYSTTTDASCLNLSSFNDAESEDIAGRWTEYAGSGGGHQGIDPSGKMRSRHDPSSLAHPIWLKGVSADRFEVEFSVRRVGGVYGRFCFIFGGRDNGQYSRLLIYHQNYPGWAADGKFAPVFGYVHNGGRNTTPSGMTRINSNMPAIDSNDVLWVRVTYDGTNINVRCGEQDNGVGIVVWQSADACTIAASDLPTGAAGRLGFMTEWDNNFRIDDFVLKTDRDANGSYETTDHEDAFTLDANGYAHETLTHDAAGNLTYDGVYQFTYDAWNRLAKVTKAYRAPGTGEIATGSVVATMRYDGAGRRIVKEVKNSAHLDCVYHYYYDGQRQIEVRNASDLVLKQQVWAPTPGSGGAGGGGGGGYIDELVQITMNDDPADMTEQDCESAFYVMQDANFNVLGIVDDAGVLIERYEYTPYGKRTVFYSAGPNDPMCMAPTQMARRWALDGSGTTTSAALGHPYAICEFGHQGLHHDEELGPDAIHNRGRYRKGERFMQRDPWMANPEFPSAGDGYQDGMNLLAYARSSPIVMRDPTGLSSYEDVEIYVDVPLGSFGKPTATGHKKGKCDCSLKYACIGKKSEKYWPTTISFEWDVTKTNPHRPWESGSCKHTYWDQWSDIIYFCGKITSKKNKKSIAFTNYCIIKIQVDRKIRRIYKRRVRSKYAYFLQEHQCH